eukprot:scaffold16675_cov517-Ochromonas_danica.AAC.1
MEEERLPNWHHRASHEAGMSALTPGLVRTSTSNGVRRARDMPISTAFCAGSPSDATITAVDEVLLAMGQVGRNILITTSTAGSIRSGLPSAAGALT